MPATPYAIPRLTKAEYDLVTTINSNPSWNRAKVLSVLKSHLQLAVTIELATIPIYLSTYYSIDRTPGTEDPKADNAFPKTAISRFADEAGALIMSVAVEEMLHMSLASNVLYSLGEDPQLYGSAPDSYPAYLPGHRKNILCSADNDSRNIPIPLAKFSFEQLSHFLAIEYPATADASPEPGNWDTIGQVYSYVRCLISSRYVCDDDFRVRQSQDQQANQIKVTEYSPNSIDTVFPTESFNYVAPLVPSATGSTAKVASYPGDEDSHLGTSELLSINSCYDALEAIATICFQGEGFAEEAYDDASKDELSHYYRFLSLQSKLVGYDQGYIEQGLQLKNNVAPIPAAPQPAQNQFSENDLSSFVYPAPSNPIAEEFADGHKELVAIADGLFQYMLVMTETVYRVPSVSQKIYFNRSMHQSMIWILDKFLRALRGIKTADGNHSLCATFANIDLGSRENAFATLTSMVQKFEKNYGAQEWYANAEVRYYVPKIVELPDVSVYWSGATPTPYPAYLETPVSPQGRGAASSPISPRTEFVTNGVYAGTPKWPLTPPADSELPEGALRHACMGLNSCKNQGRTASNDCAGQGFCATSLSYNPAAPSQPTLTDHTCHVQNDCRNQGGCGLYGTEAELAEPGHNACQSLGSCATPINAERFITDGDSRGNSVWLQARSVFAKKVWPGLKKADACLPDTPPEVPGSSDNANLFQYGPTIGWIENDNDGSGMTACGSSGMSGAGSCS